MNRKRLVAAAAAATVLALGVGGGIAYAEGSSPEQATGPGIDRAESVALGHVNGRVTGTEVGDEEGYYEVEITRDDGSQIDVHLDKNFHVLGASADHEGPDDKDAPNDD
jgi:hypothetical protein